MNFQLPSVKFNTVTHVVPGTTMFVTVDSAKTAKLLCPHATPASQLGAVALHSALAGEAIHVCVSCTAQAIGATAARMRQNQTRKRGKYRSFENGILMFIVTYFLSHAN